MQPEVTVAQAPKRGVDQRRPWSASAAGVLVLLLLFLTTGCFRPSRDTQVLRDGLLKAAGRGWDAQIELGVGSLAFGLARGGSLFLDLPPEAKTVVRTVRGADVGVYRYGGVERPQVGVAFLHAADASLSERGYERMVGVVDGHSTVGVYVPREIESTRRLKLCVVVVNESEMVIVAARGNPEPLIRMALEQAHRELEVASAE